MELIRELEQIYRKCSDNADAGRDIFQEGVIIRENTRVSRGQHDRLPSERAKVLHKLDGTIDAGRTRGREIVGDHQYLSRQHIASQPLSAIRLSVIQIYLILHTIVKNQPKSDIFVGGFEHSHIAVVGIT
jgi:hypothetical protein